MMPAHTNSVAHDIVIERFDKGSRPPRLFLKLLSMMATTKFTALFISAFALASATPHTARAASDLHLVPGLSFTDDSSSNFPIAGTALGDATVASDRATIMFFGTAHCWNTNREAERMVALYPKYHNKIDFVIVDLDHPSAAQRELIAEYYRGYIPTITVIDSKGAVLYNRAGETANTRGDSSKLEALINAAK